ncbi:Hypothetical predicted protein, partial [Pelobates cultripes]
MNGKKGWTLDKPTSPPISRCRRNLIGGGSDMKNLSPVRTVISQNDTNRSHVHVH